MKKFSLFFIMLFAVATSYAQYTFKVMASSGANKSNTGKILVGTKLNKGGNIIVGGYVSLAHKTGGVVQISKKGTYSITDLEKKLLASRTTTAGNLKKYVISGVTGGNNNVTARNRQKYMNVTGSVERGGGTIVVFLGASNKIFTDKVKIGWEKNDGIKNYRVIIIDEFEEEVINVTTKDNSYVIDFSDEKLGMSDLLKVKIDNADDPIPESFLRILPFSRLSPEEKSAYDKEWEQVQKEISVNTPSALDELTKAIFYEKHLNHPEALKSFKKAVELSNGEESYEVALNQYLIRQGIKDFEAFEEGHDGGQKND